MAKTIIKYLLVPIISILLFQNCSSLYDLKLKNTSSELLIDEFRLKLEVRIYQNVMPGAGSFGISSTNILTDENNNDISERFKLIKQTVINKNKAWKSKYYQSPSNKTNEVIGISRKGPFWKSSKGLDVICYFEDEKTKIKYKIKLENQKVALLR